MVSPRHTHPPRGPSCRWNLGTTYRRQALFVCEGLPASPPYPRKGALVTSRMEVRSALGPATTRAGGIKSNGRRPIIDPFRVLVWPNPPIETISFKAVHLGQLSPRS